MSLLIKHFWDADDKYFNTKDALLEKVSGNADYVFLVNVLHEISPLFLETEFSTFNQLLKPKTGKLIIVERSELTVGEFPYREGFLMITDNGAECLFGKDNYVIKRHPEKKHIVAYLVNQSGLNIDLNRIYDCVEAIKHDALMNIDNLKDEEKKREKLENVETLAFDETKRYEEKRYKGGLKLAFHTNQFANATIISGRISEIINK